MEKHFGNKEAAQYLGLDRRILKVYRVRYPEIFPKPVEVLGCGPIWHESQLKPLKKKLKKGGIKELRKVIKISRKDAANKSSAKKRQELLEKAKKETLDVKIEFDK